jgi:hypothetical protein
LEKKVLDYMLNGLAHMGNMMVCVGMDNSILLVNKW